MPIVPTHVNGREYQIACDNGQEEHLRRLANLVDERLQTLKAGMNQAPTEAMGLLLTALMLADELIENKNEIDQYAVEMRRLQGALLRAKTEGRDSARVAQLEQAMATTLDDIAHRIEKIAERIEFA